MIVPMLQDEFSIIEKYFNSPARQREDVLIGIGDDAAVVQVPNECELVLTIDTLVETIHFPKQAPAKFLGYKALAVSLSDLAAMGAYPCWATLALTLPEYAPDWLEQFSQGFFSLLHAYNMQLIGGNLSRGPLNISCQAHGWLPKKSAILRSGAKNGDKIFVTGCLGGAGLGLKAIQGKIFLQEAHFNTTMERYYKPIARIEAGLVLRENATAAIDISDGLIADLTHLLQMSEKGAKVNVDKLPIFPEILNYLPYEEAINLALTAGDDYELCFTICPSKEVALLKQLSEINVPVTCIGEITKEKELKLSHHNDKKFIAKGTGYKHFVESI